MMAIYQKLEVWLFWKRCYTCFDWNVMKIGVFEVADKFEYVIGVVEIDGMGKSSDVSKIWW